MLQAVVVGAGFSGIAAGVALKRAGLSFVILEKNDGVGGTWRDNTYPGAACDIPSHLYSFSFAPNPTWSRAYGGQPEILAYLERVTDTHGLRPHMRFSTRVDGATWDGACWTVRAGDQTFVARSLLLGNGALHVPSYPDIPGTFEGPSWHSARWNHAVDLRGKRVGVIGTGASAIQLVPEVAKQAAHLDVFQRTPPWIVPKRDRAMSAREQWALANLPGAHWLRRTGIYWALEARVLGFAFAPKLNELAEKLVHKHLAKQVADPALREQLTPAYRMGCKRVLISNDYYPALTRENVSLVTDRIEALEPRGVRVNGQLRELDAIIYASGFRVVDYLASMKIVAHGQDLNDVWMREHVRNYLGINVAGFPNLYLLMGPNTGLGHNSMIFMIEAQARYAVQAIQTMLRERIGYLDVTPEAERAFGDELRAKLKDTVWTSGCSSWYQAPDGQVLLWPGFTFDYWRRTRQVDLTAYHRGTVTGARTDRLAS